jgi:flagellar basal-body rod protein FlgG
MIKGLYTSAMGMLIQEADLAVTTNNLANASTVGYKRDRATFEEFPRYLERRLNDTKMSPGQKKYIPPDIGKLGAGVILDRITTNHETGVLSETDNPFDFALTEKAYFMVETPNGIRFTKDGRFQLNNAGELTTREGHRVLGINGERPTDEMPLQNMEGPLTDRIVPVVIAEPLTDFNVAEDGRIFINNAATNVSLLKVVFENTNQISKEGSNLYQLLEGEAVYAGKSVIKQSFLEHSNVNIVNEMVNMIKVSRAYEANSKILTGIDERIGQVVREVGQLRG